MIGNIRKYEEMELEMTGNDGKYQKISGNGTGNDRKYEEMMEMGLEMIGNKCKWDWKWQEM